MLGKELGHEIPTSQMQYNADYKETDKKKINASYSLEGTVLDNVEKIRYLDITIRKDLKWNTHVGSICTKANRSLGFLRRNLAACPLTGFLLDVDTVLSTLSFYRCIWISVLTCLLAGHVARR